MGTFNGFKRVLDSATSELEVRSGGQKRFDLGNFPLVTDGADSGAVLHGMGTSTTRVVIGTANKKFVSYYTENSALSGDSRGHYIRHYISGAGGGGEAARIYGTVQNVIANTVRGAHISLDFAATGKVTGLGVALECTLHIPNQGTQSGTLAAIKLAINSDGSTSDPSGAQLSYIRVDNQGNSTGQVDVDDDAYLFDIQGHTIGSGNLVEVAVDETSYSHNIRIRIGATDYYLMVANDRD